MLTFGAGSGLPGDRHALALAAGCSTCCGHGAGVPDPLRHEPHPTLRVPTNLEVSVR
ncbi:hypothetical protein NKG94_09845 [Micromonospora sp. M12]